MVQRGSRGLYLAKRKPKCNDRKHGKIPSVIAALIVVALVWFITLVWSIYNFDNESPPSVESPSTHQNHESSEHLYHPSVGALVQQSIRRGDVQSGKNQHEKKEEKREREIKEREENAPLTFAPRAEKKLDTQVSVRLQDSVSNRIPDSVSLHTGEVAIFLLSSSSLTKSRQSYLEERVKAATETWGGEPHALPTYTSHRGCLSCNPRASLTCCRCLIAPV